MGFHLMKHRLFFFGGSLIVGLALCLCAASCSKKSSEIVKEKNYQQQGSSSVKNADEVILKTIGAYNNASSFQCDGILQGKINSGTITQMEEKRVKILFVRPQQLRVEWNNLSSGDSNTNFIVAAGSGIYLYLSSSPKPLKSASLSAAIGTTAGISSELSSFIPRLLLGDNNSIHLTKVDEFREIEIDGRKHFFLVGINSVERRIELAIDQETYAISEVKETFSVKGDELQKQLDKAQIARTLPDLHVERTIKYNNVKFNDAISPSMFDQASAGK